MSWGKYVGQLVRISWRDPADDWPYFVVERVIDTQHRIARLRGADFPDGSAKHKGDSFNARFDEIKKISSIGKGT